MQCDIGKGASTIDRLSSQPDGWRRARWASGAFETAHRPMTSIVEGRILSPHHLIMATLSGGAERHEISADGGHRYDGPDLPSTVSFLPAGCERRLRLHNVAWRWAAIALDPAKISAIACTSIEALGPLSGAEDSFVWNMLAEFERLDALEGGLDTTYCDTMSSALILYLARRYGGARVKDTPIKLPAWRLRRVTDFIDAHLSGAIRVADLANLAQLSEGHFHRAFRATTGQTPLEFVHVRRVTMAKQLLASNTLSVAQMALRVGFLSPAHFARVFRSVTGQSPSQYRRSFHL
ncbi:AraC family transcriptional regulator [Bradyrhizobium sp.]|uniref:AraC family transcriptional regulator n=1 Tax=Bradyrhizobium sp. TaxID=376 RepID=UPI000ACC161D|nr:AraC family transcriptional regulator [Bradyrhizobium sp.]